jgi:hypothetical protein
MASGRSTQEISAPVPLVALSWLTRSLSLRGRIASATPAAAAGKDGITGDHLSGFRFFDPRKFTATTTFDF